MSRDNCEMIDWLGNTPYCSYYDFGYMKCDDKDVCPDGWDDDDDEWDEEE